MSCSRALVATIGFLLSACTGSVTFRSTAHQSVDLDTYSMSFMNSGLVSTGPTGNRIASIPCPQPGPAGDAYCQAIVDNANPGGDVMVRCNAMSRCDPEPYRLVVDLGVQDLEEVTSAKVSVIDHFELIDLVALIDTNTTNIDVPAFELRWGSEAASTGNLATSTQLLATVPTIVQGTTGPLDVVIDQGGLSALDAYLRDTSPRIRLFLVTSVDLDPNQALPAGDIEVTLGLIIRASGRLR